MCLIVMLFNFLETEVYTEAELTSTWISREVKSRSKGAVADRYLRIVTAIVGDSPEVLCCKVNAQVVDAEACEQLLRNVVAQGNCLKTQERTILDYAA